MLSVELVRAFLLVASWELLHQNTHRNTHRKTDKQNRQCSYSYHQLSWEYQDEIMVDLEKVQTIIIIMARSLVVNQNIVKFKH